MTPDKEMMAFANDGEMTMTGLRPVHDGGVFKLDEKQKKEVAEFLAKGDEQLARDLVGVIERVNKPREDRFEVRISEEMRGKMLEEARKTMQQLVKKN